MSRRRFLASALGAFAAPALVRTARGQGQITLKLHHFFSSVSSPHDKFLAPWARKVETESGGRLRIDIFPSMELGGQPAQLLDQVRDGVVDIVWAAPSRTPGRYPKIELFELPFLASRRALVSSKALEDFAAAHLKDEFADVRPICFSCTDRGLIHSARPVANVDDIKGQRLQVPTRFAAEAVRLLGGRPVPMPNAQIPMAFGARVIDGCVEPWDVAPGLRLYDYLKAHTDFAEHTLSTTTFALAMNKASYERLPHELKTVINDNSGQLAAGMAGAMWDMAAAAVVDTVTQRGQPILTVGPEALGRWRRATEPVIEAWLKHMKERRVEGGKLLSSARVLLTKYVLEPEPRPARPPQQPQTATQKPVNRPRGAEVKAGAAAPPKPDGAVVPKVDGAAAPATTGAAKPAAAAAAPPAPAAHAVPPAASPPAAAAKAAPAPVSPPPAPAPAAPPRAAPAAKPAPKVLDIPI